MGTRGSYGFRINGQDKITYNQYDSYPEVLGRAMLNFCRDHPVDELRKIAEGLVLVAEGSCPSVEAQVLCQDLGVVDLGVSSRSMDDWYCLLRGAQGIPEYWAKGLPYLTDYRGFLRNSAPLCEWGYVVNLDEGVLEVYEGTRTLGTTPDENTWKDDLFWTVSLVASYPLNSLYGLDDFEVERIISELSE